MPDREKVIKGLECCLNSDIMNDGEECGYENGDFPECPYNDDVGVCQCALMGDALALLKQQAQDLTDIHADLQESIADNLRLQELVNAQEPRVMTLEELEDWDGAVFFEAYETDMYYALIENVELTAGMDGEFVLVNVVPGEHHRHIWGGKHYGSIWRVWTSRPTEKQMEATPWE